MRTIPDAAAHLSAAHHRARHRKVQGKPTKVPGIIFTRVRLIIGALILVGLTSVAALMLRVLN